MTLLYATLTIKLLITLTIKLNITLLYVNSIGLGLV